jgi:reactive intermediate/imine deaminase
MQAVQVVTQPDPYAPFLLSQAIQAGNLIFVSRQAGYDDAGAIVGEGDFERQADQAFRNLERALKAGGSGLERIVKVTIFVTSMRHAENLLALRRKYYRQPWPAETLVEIAALYTPGALIEIEAVALCD